MDGVSFLNFDQHLVQSTFLFPLPPPAKILGEVLPNMRGATNMIHDAIKQQFIGAAYIKKIREI
jgi:hypothetical protein